jgi:hypothetical protein
MANTHNGKEDAKMTPVLKALQDLQGLQHFELPGLDHPSVYRVREKHDDGTVQVDLVCRHRDDDSSTLRLPETAVVRTVRREDVLHHHRVNPFSWCHWVGPREG